MGIADDASLTEVSDGMNIDATIVVQFNKYIYLYDAFPSGYTPPTPFSFTIWGFTNPPTAAITDSFHVCIFYEEGVNEVSNYQGTTALTVTASASTKVSFRAENSESHTGDSNTQFTFYGST